MGSKSKKITDQSVFSWTSVRISSRDLVKDYGNKLPVIVMFTEGWMGESEEQTCTALEILRIEQMDRQKRVIARDSNNRYLSLPCSNKYPTQVHVLKDGQPKGKPVLLADVARTQTLRAHVKLVDDKDHLGALELVRTHEEIYFIGNCVDPKGYLYPVVVVIPAFIDVRMVVANGLKERPHSEWDAMVRGFNESAKHINYNQVKAGQDVHMYDRAVVKSADDINPYVEPTEYVRLPHPRGETSTDGTIKGVPEVKPRGGKPPTPTKRPLPATPGGVDGSYVVLHNKAGAYQTLREAKSVHGVNENVYDELQQALQQRGLGKQSPGVAAIAPSVVTAAKQNPPSGGKFASLNDIPEDLSKLSTDEVGECLRMLRLGSHVDSFVENQIDGAMLSSLDEQILVNDLGLNTLNARKLVMFTRNGWRPK